VSEKMGTLQSTFEQAQKKDQTELLPLIKMLFFSFVGQLSVSEYPWQSPYFIIEKNNF